MKETHPDTPALSARRLTLGYPRAKPPVQLCKPLDFQLKAGSLTAVIGVNGIGKSTLLRTLAGMQPALDGSTELLGTPATRLAPNEKARVLSVVLTDAPASRNLKVRELVALGRHPYTNWLGSLSEADRESVRGALEEMELLDLADRACYTLSDGQLQRVLIARALAQETPVILLDEPTTHLDLYHKVRILKGLREIALSRGKTVVFTTHEIDLAIQLCTHLLLLQEKEFAFGQPCELIASGAFESLFPTDTVQFDPELGAFKVRK